MKLLAFLTLVLFGFPIISNAQLSTGSFMHDGIQRDYVVYVPTSYNGNNAVPLVLNFHGFGGNGGNQMTATNFQPIADTAGFIVVCPSGTPLSGIGPNHWNVGGWTQTSTIDDIGFASALIDTIAANYNIELTRVYSTGFSNGGFFSHRLACELPNRIAAIAPVSGTFTPQMEQNCSPSHPTPVLHIHGTSDAVVPYNGTSGNGGMTAVDTVINFWVNYNNCSNTPTSTNIPNTNTNDGSTVEHFVYTGGTSGTQVELMKIDSGGHTWPGNPGGNQDINGSLEIWKFFSRYSNTAVGTKEFENIKQSIKIFPNPSNGYVQINNTTKESYDYKIQNMIGNILVQGKIQAGLSKIDLRRLANAIYTINIDGQAFKILKRD